MDKHQPTIVVVDSDTDFSTVLSSILDRKGYRAVRRSCGIDALQFIEQNHPDLVLSDVDLPDYDSLEMLHSIRAVSPSTQVLFTSRGRHTARHCVGLNDTVVVMPREPRNADGVFQAVDRLLERVA